ncbi:MAG: hypothetical protein JNL18_22025 [Planctomycetaceae bacterium]|uniref:Uncharacterized protein n=1 Tax=Lacipirellula limnantheis TaxID=2528024 RepID=A0A517U2H7_9BACT|nr:hypothetical protein [Lacipirellula limnantheis]MBL9165421.1 hypothetical protein [Planctomycetaceae bacterium]QDT74810.1 hypothetical protein I41_40130 [Lacipirellula limnantheis]
MLYLQTAPEAESSIAVGDHADSLLFVPFLGTVIACRSEAEVAVVGSASEALRSVDLAATSIVELNAVIDSVTLPAGPDVCQAIERRIAEMRKLY